MGYVLITGGNLINKGAQAMVFVAVDEVKRRFPDKEVVVISDVDAARSDGELAKYKFLFRDGVCIYGWKYKLLQHRYGRLDRHGDAAYIRKHTDMIIDVSGYTFGSNWGLLANLLAAYRVPMAIRMCCPIYFMPQSFGPFEWKGIRKKIADRYMRPWLLKARMLFGREQQGCELLRRYYDMPLVRYAPDIVLTNRGVDRRELFRCPPRPRGEEVVPDTVLARNWYAEEPEIPEIAPHSVGIVPNVRNDRYGGAGQMDALYRRAIEKFLEMGRTVYIIRHAVQDRDVCRRIKSFYEKDRRVVLLEEEMDCFAYSALAARFDYLIASRYHAVVHAYKEGTPCIVPGWAVKYQELLKLFDQQKYEIDVRTQQPDAIDEPIARMEERYADEAVKIGEKLVKLQRGNVFDIIDRSQKSSGIRKDEDEDVCNVEDERECVCCRICAVVCPAECIHFERRSGYYLPIVDRKLCIHCGRCVRVCYGLARTHRIPAAMPHRALTAQAKDEELLMRATSGGVVTAMVDRLLRDGVYDNAYLVEGFDDEYQLSTREFLPGEDLSTTQKSRYVPVSHQNAVSGILAHPEKRSIFVGCACAVYGLLEAMKLSGADREHVLIIGLFCDRALTYSFYDYFRTRYPKRIKESGQIRDIYFRDKRAGGWPGDMRFVFEDGSSMDVSAKERMCVKDFFTLRRCVECDDKFNRQADISVGDNYTGKNSDKKGTSSVLLYTDRGTAAWEHCEDAFVTAPASAEEICESQHAEWEKAFACTKDGEKVDLPDEVVNDKDFSYALMDYALGELALYNMIPKYSKEKKKQMYQDALREKIGL
ncbi:MAG: Coenzyme F420 hydrogenase/dehydrogenase, beta subunit C-terminal domain [bacterium]|nr:Coenzyme F420 hydrogenase/dehydrogenase, beta subunit C-terminal domain [bacterium]